MRASIKGSGRASGKGGEQGIQKRTMSFPGVRGETEISKEENMRPRKKVEDQRGKRRRKIWEVEIPGVGIFSSPLCPNSWSVAISGVWPHPEYMAIGHSPQWFQNTDCPIRVVLKPPDFNFETKSSSMILNKKRKKK